MPIQLCPLPLQNLMTWKLQRRLISETKSTNRNADSYTTNVDDSPYVEEPFQDSGSSYAPSEEYGSDSTSDAMEKAPDEEQESSRITVVIFQTIDIKCRKDKDDPVTPKAKLRITKKPQ
ncbi:hypothetical protein FQA39_LY18988 [Lamprigera yunnana]|nr:hypothetical protein FQA39_LY18988 [Lamprigera yunnana]